MIKTLKDRFIISQESASEEATLEEFKQNYLENKEFLRVSIYWMIRCDEVDDLVQTTFVKAWQHYNKFKKDSSFKTWVYRIAMNTTYDYLKKNNKRKTDNDINDIADFSQDNELKDVITKALKTLKPRQREVFILYYKLGYKIQEIASLVDAPEGTVKSRLHHAKDQFTFFLKKNGVSDEG